jgi:hypothetical protein
MDIADLYRRRPLAKGRLLLPALFLAATLPSSVLHAQSLPPGTTLPVRLLHTLNSEKDGPGKTFVVKTTQAIPVPGNQTIRRGTKIIGHIVATQAPDANNHLSRLTVHFDKLLSSSDKQAPILVGLRAMAGFMAVREAEAPTNDPDMGPSNWTTVQIGGDVVYRGGGPVTSSWGQVVGKPVPDGVVARLLAPREGTYPSKLHCSSDEASHALGLFASNACGLYGFSHLTIEHDGFTQPEGQITLVASSKSVKVASGSQLLLQVVNQ